MNELMIIVGTRPEVIKMAPVIRALQKQGQEFTFVYSGQHYDYTLSLQFIEELGLPQPTYSLKLQHSSLGHQTGRMLIDLGRIMEKEKPKLLLVEGDTNSVLAAALAANKQRVLIGHVEAGLRSFDLRMPEEHNRCMVDHISDYLFAPTQGAKRNLKRENVWGSIYITGNTVIDAVFQHLPIAEKNSRILEKVKFEEYALVTIHRAENVDDLEVLKNFVDSFVEAPIPIVLPIHPRTEKRLRHFNLWKKLSFSNNVQLFPPVGYFDLLILMKNSKMVLTDSGGLQEEATAPVMRKVVLVLRLSTERPEAVEAGFAKIVGVKQEGILEAIKNVTNEKQDLPKVSPFGDGTSGKKISEIVIKKVLEKPSINPLGNIRA